MNRRTFLSSTLAAAMMAVATRLGFEAEAPKLPPSQCATSEATVTMTWHMPDGTSRTHTGMLYYDADGVMHSTLTGETYQAWPG